MDKIIRPSQGPGGKDSTGNQNERAILSQIGKLSGAPMLQGNASDIHPAEGFPLKLFVCLLETYHFDDYSFSGQCFGGSARSGVRGISRIHHSDGPFPSQMERYDIGSAQLWAAGGRRLHLLVGLTVRTRTPLCRTLQIRIPLFEDTPYRLLNEMTLIIGRRISPNHALLHAGGDQFRNPPFAFRAPA
jgi:hypothetical protein